MQNCWEFKKCGREPGGFKVDEEGVCPAATYEAADGFLGGRNGGRACAFITGSLCCETLPGTVRDKEKNCEPCSFFNELKYFHGRNFSLKALLQKVKHHTR